MNAIVAHAVFPKEIMDTRKKPDEYRTAMEVPYRESVARMAEDEGVKIGEIKRVDYGLQPAEIVDELVYENGVESYVTRFIANVIEDDNGTE